MELQRAKGMRDYAPEQMLSRNKVLQKITQVFEQYGYAPLETPLLERMDVLTAKFGAGATSDVVKEIFSLKDQGKRSLGLRFDLTVPFARFVGMNPTIKMPFKRYQIGRVYRDGPIKAGRYREFWQCDVDVVGCSKMTADAECIMIALDVFKALDLDVEIFVNNRLALMGILEFAGVQGNAEQVIIAIDKLDKIGEAGVKKELKDYLEKDVIAKLMKVLSLTGNNSQLLKMLRNTIGDNEGITQLEELFSLVENDSVKLNVALARGLSYYTGTVFEAFLTGREISSSLCGGGRYDNLIGGYLKTTKEYPAVGISFGVEPITDVLKIESIKTPAQVYVIPIKTTKQCITLCKRLREAGLNVSLDLVGRGVSKNLEYANALGIPFCVIVGENELQSGKLKLKNMTTGTEDDVTVEMVAGIIQKS